MCIRDRAEAERVVSAIEARVARDLGRPLPSPEPPMSMAREGPETALFRPPYRKRTLALIVFHLFQTVGYYGFANWLPTLLVSQGVTIGKSLGYSVVIALVPPIAPLAFSAIADRLERKWLIVAGALGAVSYTHLCAAPRRPRARCEPPGAHGLAHLLPRRTL